MMAKRRQNSLFGELLKKHANDETDYGQDFTKLPADIQGGIAKLTMAKMGNYKTGDNEGNPFIYLGGSVIEPTMAIRTTRVFEDGKVRIVSSKEENIKGLLTGLTLPLCETANKSEEDNVAAALNELRKLGGQECLEELSDIKELPELLTTLVESEIYFRFATSGSKLSEEYPTERVWENWHGAKGLEDYEPDDEDGSVADATESETESEEPEDSDSEDGPDDGDEEKQTLEELGVLADEEEEAGDDEDNTNRQILIDKASSAGLDHEDDAFPMWSDLATQLQKDLDDEDGDEGDEDDEVVEPVKGEATFYKPPKHLKALDFKITAVFPGKKTCNLKGIDNPKKIFKAVPWRDLQDSE